MVTVRSAMTEESPPNYAVPTGEYIDEWLTDHELNAAELARRLDVSRKHVSMLLHGKVALTPDIAVGLERVTGVPAGRWSSLEAQYQADKARLAEEAELAAEYPTAQVYPLKYLRKCGFITASARDHGATVRQLLEFFGVATLLAIEESWAGGVVAYRKSAARAQCAEHLMTWLRLAERWTPVIDLPPFDKAALKASISSLRAMTLEEPSTYIRGVIARLADVGVGLSFVPEVPGLGVYGATRWVHRHPLMQLSLRGKTDDQLWFTLFHEIGHVLLHSPNGLYLNGVDAAPEVEADRFAADTLIPPEFIADMPRGRNIQAVRAFAESVGVAPGVVLGRVQREINDFAWGSELKRHFEFSYT